MDILELSSCPKSDTWAQRMRTHAEEEGGQPWKETSDIIALATDVTTAQHELPSFMGFNVAQGDATKMSNCVTVPTSQGEVTYELVGT